MAVGLALRMAAHRYGQARQPGGDPLRSVAVNPLPRGARRAEIETVAPLLLAVPQCGRHRGFDLAVGNRDAVNLARPIEGYEPGGDIGGDHLGDALERVAKEAPSPTPQTEDHGK